MTRAMSCSACMSAAFFVIQSFTRLAVEFGTIDYCCWLWFVVRATRGEDTSQLVVFNTLACF